MPETKTKPARVSVQPFGVEIDHHTNCDCLLQSIPGCRLRTAIKPTRTVKGVRHPDGIQPLGMTISTPGMQIHVNPAKREYTIVDPMYDDDELCERVRRHLREKTSFNMADRLRGEEPKKGELDADRMKCLCRELLWLLDEGDARMVKGVKPDIEDINELPGDYLLNPGSIVPNMQPRYEKDFEEWVQGLARTGG
jgi:hypothetical protein